MKLNVLIVNKNRSECAKWAKMLSASGKNVVGQEYGLSGMTAVLCRRPVHIVVCSSLIISKNSHTVLQSAMRFFPRVKFVIVGGFFDTKDIPRLGNFVLKPSFDCELDGLFPFPTDAEENFAQNGLKLLLGENFLTSDEADSLLGQLAPNMAPDFAVISVLCDTPAAPLFPIIEGFAKTLPLALTAQVSLDESCIVSGSSPDAQKTIEIADGLRRALIESSNISFNIGISRRRGTAGELFACRREALQAASAYELYGRESVIHIDYLGDKDIWYLYPRHKEERMIDLAIAGSPQKALALLDEIIGFLKAQDLRKQYTRKVAVRIWAELNLAVASRAPALETAQTDSMSFGKLFSGKSDEDVYSFLKKSIESFAAEMKALNDVRRDALFMRLESLKNEGPEIDISTLAARYHTTVCFLNDAIVKNSDKNIFNYFAGD
ncbi:MAG: hypothetical protein FWH02_02570 [Oscillospiraceae bacterium]|nr:hypothetical protein [Oscillospiraceae bacterium]